MRTRQLSAWIALAAFLVILANAPTAAAVTPGCSTPTSRYGSLVAGTGGLVSYWRLGQASGTTACDSKGSNAGTYQGGFTLGQPGALVGDPDTAVRLNGSTGDVSVAHGSSLNVGDSFTIEAWVKRGSVGGSANQAIASQQSQSWLLMFDSGNHLVLRRSTVADVVSSTATVADTTKWHHVAATKSGGAVKLYIDGVDVTGTVANQTMSTNTLPLVIGQSSNTAWYNGVVDEVALYGSPLTAAQVKAHYDAGASSPTSDPVIAAAGDIACDPADPSYNGGAGTATACRQKYTSNLLVGTGLTGVVTLGDEQYDDATLSKFQQVYASTWGRVNNLGRPSVGNHEYLTPGAAGYFDYFNGVGNFTGRAGDRDKGYYSYDIGRWHLISINSNCSAVSCAAGSKQENWLRADLAAHPTTCTLVYWHHPRFSSGIAGNATSMAAMWQDLYAANADLILSAHDHEYERFAPQTPTAASDPARGIREFVVGTGGKSQKAFATVQPNSQVRATGTYGVLRLTLHPASYDWKFAPEAGKTFTDSGTQACH